MGADAESWRQSAKQSASLRERATSQYSSSPAPAGGRYVTETIGDRSFTSFVPQNTRVYSGSVSKGDAVLIADTTKDALPSRMEYGNIVSDNNVPISGSVFKMLEEQRLGGQPMSIRTDVDYRVNLRMDRSGVSNPRVVNQSIAPSYPSPILGSGGWVSVRRDVSPFNQAVDPWPTKLREQPIQYGFQVAQGGVDLLASGGLGLLKIFESEIRANPLRATPLAMFAPFDVNLRSGNLVDISGTMSRRLALLQDKDVQVAAIGVGATMASTFGGAAVAKAIEWGSIGLGSYTVFKGATSNQPSVVGEGLVIASAGRPFSKLKRGFTEVVGIKEPAVDVFGGEVSGRPVSARSLSESLRFFEQGRMPNGKIEVVHASPSILSGKQLQAGAKGLAGIEDAGTFFAPKGRANLGFTGIGDRPSSSELANPFEGTPQPSASAFIARGILRYPRSALLEPGFDTPSQHAFLDRFKGSGFLVVTKRSELGQGEIPRQLFSPREFVALRTTSFEPGRFYLEAGTREAEVVAPGGSVFSKQMSGLGERFKYTVVNQKQLFGRDVPLTGDLIRLPKYQFEITKGVGSGLARSKKLFSFEDVVARDDLSFSSYASSKSRVSPNYGFSGSNGFFNSRIGSISPSNPLSGGSSPFASSRSPIASISGIGIGSEPSGYPSRSPSLARGSSSSLAKSLGISSFASPFASSASAISGFSAPSISAFGSSKPRSGKRVGKMPGSRLVPFNPKYFASIEAVALGVKGKPSKGAIISGLDIRPMRF